MFNIQINRNEYRSSSQENDIGITKAFISNQIIVYQFEIGMEKPNASFEAMKIENLYARQYIEYTSHVTRFAEQLTSRIPEEMVKNKLHV